MYTCYEKLSHLRISSYFSYSSEYMSFQMDLHFTAFLTNPIAPVTTNAPLIFAKKPLERKSVKPAPKLTRAKPDAIIHESSETSSSLFNISSVSLASNSLTSASG